MTRKELIEHVRQSDPMLKDETPEQLDAAIRLLYPVAKFMASVANRRIRHEGRHICPRVVG